jgi:MinD-like ATPase involved in chromosome partitioning or flagellar assembly
VMGMDQATKASYDVLIVDDVCSFLTPRLVAMIKQAGAEVIGVYMPEDGSDAKRRLLECGISDVIETEASPEEFLAKIGTALAHRSEAPATEPSMTSPALRIAVTGACEGVGMTEVAVALAQSLTNDLEAVLVDLDQRWPSVAQRLNLPVHPNIRTALDHALHRIERLDEAIHLLGDLMIVGGRADGGRGAEISRSDSMMLLDALGTRSEVIVADIGPFHGSSALLREFDTAILVGEGTPVGVSRLVKTAGAILTQYQAQSLLVVVNKTGRGSFRRFEILKEIGRVLPDVPAVTLPYETRVEPAAWDGTLLQKGRYGRAVGEVSKVVVRSLR